MVGVQIEGGELFVDRSVMSAEGKGLTKWQLAALGAGAVVVVAGGALVAYACVKRRRKPIKPDPEATPQSGSEKSGSGGRSEAAAASKPASEPKVLVFDMLCRF